MPDVLIFDSGVGGLSVSEDIARLLPGASLGYLCDNAALPYGTKPDAWLLARIVEVCVSACERLGSQVLVIACNTASTLALAALRERLSIAVVGTVPAIKPAAAATRSGTIGILATSATLYRPYLDGLIARHAPNCRIERLIGDALVAQAERHLAGGSLDDAVIREVLAPLVHVPALDTMVLGCTHFPLLRDALAGHAPRPLAWIDSGAAIARRVAQVLPVAPACGGGHGRRAPWASWATNPDASGLAAALAGFGYAPAALFAASPVRLASVDGMPSV